MKKILILCLFSAFLVTVWLTGKEKPKNGNKPAKELTKMQELMRDKRMENAIKPHGKSPGKEHQKEALNCKACHECEYPTKQDPCLLKCPKTETSVYHSPEEGPGVVIMDNISKRYGPVVFSHKLHAQMSEMSHGCIGCHHYNTTGPVLGCDKCHEQNRLRQDVSKPDQEAAYHRQCMNCHRQWSRSTDCNQCHLPKGPVGMAKKDEEIKRINTLKHPEVAKPIKLVYETKSAKGKFVTFFHEEHNKTFNIACMKCHKDENCLKCHDVKIMASNPKQYDAHVTKPKSFDDHHKLCTTCHEKNNCAKCHKDKETTPFNHALATGWDLGQWHSKLACQKCHTDNKYTKIHNGCTGCHNNFAAGKFNHQVTGLVLSDNHKDNDCNSCHTDLNFGKKPVCTECHDDKAYPVQMPGKKVKKVKS